MSVVQEREFQNTLQLRIMETRRIALMREQVQYTVYVRMYGLVSFCVLLVFVLFLAALLSKCKFMGHFPYLGCGYHYRVICSSHDPLITANLVALLHALIWQVTHGAAVVPPASSIQKFI